MMPHHLHILCCVFSTNKDILQHNHNAAIKIRKLISICYTVQSSDLIQVVQLMPSFYLLYFILFIFNFFGCALWHVGS